ncbi:MAG: site-specific DNA-methyltransferase [Rikenellaceae bacterium]
MHNLKLLEELYKLLRMESRYCSEDGVLLKNSIVESALALRPDLIKLLLSHEGIKSNFFTDVEGVMVFDKIRFQKFVMNKRFLPDSYTSFKNKIGLTGDDGDFLADSREVVLSWPYKDCVLEGGQTKEDAKRNEVFWNEILAPDEINRLTEPKALTSFARYDADGKHEVSEISDKDNLIIKGNNLLALHSLLKSYRGKVKLIYIDPPFNTENDSFQYNDSFKHTTWLTFMRNRLTVARELLRKDGLLFIHIDNNECAYLTILCDEIFGRENQVNTIAVRSSTPSGTKTAHRDKTVIKQKDFILLYKNGENITINPQYVKREKWDTHYSLFLKQVDGQYVLDKLTPILVKENILSKGETLDDVNIENQKFKSFYLRYKDQICRLQSHKNKDAEIESRKQQGVVYEHFDASGTSKGLYYNGQVITPLAQGVKKVYSDQKYTEDLGMLLCDFWYDIDFQNTQNEGGVKFPTAKKPEVLLARIIDMATQEGDIVLDYHLGSGTTAAVAHKMGRRYIGMEQMDYIETVAVERLKKVVGVKSADGMFDKVECDQGGISKAVNWQGGGSFVYCELAKANQQFAEDIIAATTKEQLQELWKTIEQTGFISYKVSPNIANQAAQSFDDLSIEDLQTFLLEILDKNLLYVPLSDIDDENYNISESDKLLNTQFYGAN